jgi:hypothetical protein
MFSNLPHDFLTGIKYLQTGANRRAVSAIAQTPGSIFFPSVNAITDINDGGFNVDRPLALNDLMFAPGAATGVTVVAASGATGSCSVAFITGTSPTVLAYIQLPIPRDYDEASDTFALRLMVNQKAQVTDTNVQITGQMTIRPSIEVSATAGAVLPFTSSAFYAQTPFSANIGSTSNGQPVTAITPLLQVLEIPFIGVGLKRDQVITIQISSKNNLTAGDALQLYGLNYTYASTLVSYNPTDATDNFTNSVNPGGNMGQGIVPNLNLTGNSLR